MSLKNVIIALGIGVGGYTIAKGVPSTQSDAGQDQRRNKKIGGIPQHAQGVSRGFGVPDTTKNITKKSVSVKEGDTNITEIYDVDNTPDSKKESSSSGRTDIIQDEESGTVIRDASPDNDSNTKKEHENLVMV